MYMHVHVRARLLSWGREEGIKLVSFGLRVSKITQCLSRSPMCAVESSTVSPESLARRLSPNDVAAFLTKIQLPQYVESFRSSEISGELLLEADPEILEELGVASPVHQMKIMQLFRRELEGSVGAKYDQDHVIRFLQQYKLEKYVSALGEHGIDGDMVLQVEEKLMKSVLREVGVASLVDNLKIRSKYKTFVSDKP